jgi:hypothetical protein
MDLIFDRERDDIYICQTLFQKQLEKESELTIIKLISNHQFFFIKTITICFSTGN